MQNNSTRIEIIETVYHNPTNPLIIEKIEHQISIDGEEVYNVCVKSFYAHKSTNIHNALNAFLASFYKETESSHNSRCNACNALSLLSATWFKIINFFK